MYGVAIGLRDRSNPFTRNLFGNLSLTSPTRVKCSATAFSTTSTPIETTPWPVWHPLRSRCLGDRPISPFEQDVRTWPGAKSPEALVASRSKMQRGALAKHGMQEAVVVGGGFKRSADDKSGVHIASLQDASLQQGSIGGMGVQQGTLRSSLRGVAFWSLGGSLIYNFNQGCCFVCNFKRSSRGDNVDALDGSASWRAWTLTDCSIQLAVWQ